MNAFFVAWICSAAAMTAGGAPTEGCFRVVVHPSNQTPALEIKWLKRVFYKHVSHWPDGTPAVAVDQPPGSPTRRLFSHTVFNKTPRALARYWQMQIFGGYDVPPPEMANDQGVLDYVRREPGAIGYVSCTVLPAKGVRVLPLVQDGEPVLPDHP